MKDDDSDADDTNDALSSAHVNIRLGQSDKTRVTWNWGLAQRFKYFSCEVATSLDL